MAAGDVVNGISTTSSALTFQPAAGVEVIITCLALYNQWLRINDGTSSAIVLNFGTNTAAGASMNIKVAINNTNYIALDGVTGNSCGYTGIQTK